LRNVMRGHSKLERISLQHMQLSASTTRILSQGLKANKRASGSLPLKLVLEELELRDSGEEEVDAVACLAEGLAENKTLGSLELRFVPLSDRRFASIITSLVGHPTLSELVIYDGNIEEHHPQSHVALQKILASPSCKLLDLDLSDQVHFFDFANDSCLDWLVKGLRQNHSLRSLDLSGNHLDHGKLRQLLSCLSDCPTLTDIDFSHNKIAQLDLACCLFPGGKLTRLDMDRNPLFESYEADVILSANIFQLLENNPQLGDLGVEYMLSEYDPMILHLMDMNRHGRILLQNDSVPLSVWPIVLERVMRDSLFDTNETRMSNVIYHLMHGPAFAGRGYFDE
jgi:hypothetical protein